LRDIALVGMIPAKLRGRGHEKKMAFILYVEYHSAVRQAASSVFDHEPDLQVVSQAASVAEGRQKMAQGGIDAAIVNIPLPDEGDEEFVRELHEAKPSIPVLVMTDLEDQEIGPRFLGAGAQEVVFKEASLAEVLAAVRRLGGEG
jgi:DNA-binding NarL/FixJ family response regulator